MIYDTPWDTTACAALPVDEFRRKAITALTYGGRDVAVNTGGSIPPFKIRLIEGTTEHQKVVPAFTFPIIYDAPDNPNQKKNIILDIRSCGSEQNGVFKVSNMGSTEFRFKMKQAIINYLWVLEHFDKIMSTSAFPLKAYAKFISNIITRGYYLEPHQSIRVQVFAGWFYICQFTDKRVYTDYDRTMIMGKLLKTLGEKVITETMIESWLKDAPVLETLDDFLKFVAERSDAVQLSSLNIQTFYSKLAGGCLIGGTIPGRSYLQAAIEHPPTWIALLLETCLNRGSSKTLLGTALQDSGLKKIEGDFVKAFHQLIGGKDAIKDFDYEKYFVY